MTQPATRPRHALQRWLLAIVTLCALVSASASAEIAIVVNPANPIKDAEAIVLKRIFNGTMREFPQSGITVSLLDQPMDTDIHAKFYKQMFNVTPKKMKRRRATYVFSGQGAAPSVLRDDEEIRTRVANEVSSIGYMDASKVDGSVRVIWTLKE